MQYSYRRTYFTQGDAKLFSRKRYLKFFEKTWNKGKIFLKTDGKNLHFWPLFQFKLGGGKCKRQEKEHYLQELICIGQLWEVVAMYVGCISYSYLGILWGSEAGTLPMCNTKAVPVVWNNFYFTGSLKDRHYDCIKKFCMTLLPFCGFLAALSGYDL